MKITVDEISPYAGAQLGSGGFAKVYRLDGFRLPDANYPVAYKAYKNKYRNVSAVALDALAAVRDRMPDKQKARLDSLTTWPIRTVVSSATPGFAKGILMRELPEEFFFDMPQLNAPPARELKELKYAAQSMKDCAAAGLKYLTLGERLLILEKLAYTLAFLHKAKIVYGDLSMRNVVYAERSDGTISVVLVDCDAALLAGTTPVFDKQPHTPDYWPPEARMAEQQLRALKGRLTASHTDALNYAWARQTYETDTYKFGLIALRLMDPGRGALQRYDPTSALEKMPGRTRELLTATLSDHASSRPSMGEWWRQLSGETELPNPQIKRRQKVAEKPHVIETTKRKPTRVIKTNAGEIPGWIKNNDGSWARIK